MSDSEDAHAGQDIESSSDEEEDLSEEEQQQHLQHIVASFSTNLDRLSLKPWLRPRFNAAHACATGESCAHCTPPICGIHSTII
jgi:hypothetical protein